MKAMAILISMLVLVGMCSPVVAASSGSTRYWHPYPWDVKPGDLVIGYSGDKLGTAIPGYWNHVGMVVYYDYYVGDWIVIESNPDPGVALSTLSDFMARHKDIAILRVATTDSIRIAAVNFALQQLGKPYDFALWDKQVYGKSYYCSELVWASYKAVGGPDIDAHPGWHWKYLNAVAPQEVYDDNDTYVVYRHTA